MGASAMPPLREGSVFRGTRERTPPREARLYWRLASWQNAHGFDDARIRDHICVSSLDRDRDNTQGHGRDYDHDHDPHYCLECDPDLLANTITVAMSCLELRYNHIRYLANGAVHSALASRNAFPANGGAQAGELNHSFLDEEMVSEMRSQKIFI